MDSRHAIIPGFVLIATLISFLVSGFRPLHGYESSPPPSSDINQITSKADIQSLHSHFPEKIQQWSALIIKYAAQHELPANLIAAVIWVESGGDPYAFSHSGAVGLMQIMPRDGIAASFLCNGQPCFSKRPNIAQLTDPDFNVDYGARMLAVLYKKTGSFREALHAYGPMDAGYSYADKVLAIFHSTL